MEENCKRSQGSERAVVLLKKKKMGFYVNDTLDKFLMKI